MLSKKISNLWDYLILEVINCFLNEQNIFKKIEYSENISLIKLLLFQTFKKLSLIGILIKYINRFFIYGM